jgi:F0F1-type ATP synthase membrane subunit c/vacuolar-type H+-ATPase subunit K
MTGLTFLTAVLALAVSVAGGLWLVPTVLRLAARGDRDGGADGARVPTPTRDGGRQDVTREEEESGPTSATARSVLRGGTWIGILERLAVTGCVIAGFPAGIAVVVAVKGLGRYPELRENPGVSERFVIGTLASLVWAGAVAWLATWVFTLL